jgi:hypothetical protein
MPAYAELLQVHLSPKLLIFVQDLCDRIIMDRRSVIVEYNLSVDKIGPKNLIVNLTKDLLDKSCPDWYIYHVQVKQEVNIEVDEIGNVAVLVALHKGLHQWPHIDFVWANDSQYFCVMPLFNGQIDTYHLRPMARQKYTKILNKANAGKKNNTPEYWNTFINECLTLRFHDFATKRTKHNEGVLRQLNQLHFGSGVGQERLVRCVPFFTVNAPNEFDSSKTVRIGQIKEGKNLE